MKSASRVLSVVTCITVLAGAIAAANAAPERAASNPLRVDLFPADNGAVEVRITNTSNKNARVPKWQLPEDVLESNLFRVNRDGKPVKYEGALVKRALPEPQDFAILRPGQTYTTLVDLAATYDMSQPGDYSVTLASPLQHASMSGGERLESARGKPMLLQSPSLRMWHSGGMEPLSRNVSKNITAKGQPSAKGGKITLSGGVNYARCDATQISTIASAISAARTYSENAKGYLNAGTTGPRYTTWFGASTASRYVTATSNFSAIDAAIDQSNGEITINCGCTKSYYAWVYANNEYEINVCRAFWTAPLTGTDSKAGTLIHEMSHFDVVAGTDDIVYGPAGAKNLAITNPDAALNNADNHEYFAENTPSQN